MLVVPETRAAIWAQHTLLPPSRPMPKLKPEISAARREHILTAALSCIGRKGYHQTTLDDIAAEAGLSKGGVYVYFDSKKALYIALFESVLEESGITQRLQVSGVTVHERLANMLTAMVEAMVKPKFQKKAPLILDIWLQNLHDPYFQERVSALYDQYREPLAGIIEEGVAAGEFRPVDASALANILLGAFDGIMVQMLIDESAVNISAISQTLRTLVDGLLLET